MASSERYSWSPLTSTTCLPLQGPSLPSRTTGGSAAANLPRAKARAACLGLAGVDLNEGTDIIRGWSDRVGLAGAVAVANDATLLFAAGTPDGWGLAVIAGTGSIAFTLDRHGKDAR